jgi:hypothetical protein
LNCPRKVPPITGDTLGRRTFVGISVIMVEPQAIAFVVRTEPYLALEVLAAIPNPVPGSYFDAGRRSGSPPVRIVMETRR